MDKLNAELESVVRRHGALGDEEVAQEVREIKVVIGRRIEELVRPMEVGRDEIVGSLATTVRRTRTIERRQLFIIAALLVLAVVLAVSVVLDPM